MWTGDLLFILNTQSPCSVRFLTKGGRERGRRIWIISWKMKIDWYSDKVLHVSFHITFEGFWSLSYLIILCVIKNNGS